MKNTVPKTANQNSRFVPNMDNFEVSLSYEGLALKKTSERKTITDLKRKYAR
jgi:hypothetical protein